MNDALDPFTAMPSWRPMSQTAFWLEHDFVIATEVTNRGRLYEVYAFGQIVARRYSLRAAKDVIESVHGSKHWTRKSLPSVSVPHPFGPTDEFTEPRNIYVASDE